MRLVQKVELTWNKYEGGDRKSVKYAITHKDEDNKYEH